MANGRGLNPQQEIFVNQIVAGATPLEAAKAAKFKNPVKAANNVPLSTKVQLEILRRKKLKHG